MTPCKTTVNYQNRSLHLTIFGIKITTTSKHWQKSKELEFISYYLVNVLPLFLNDCLRKSYPSRSGRFSTPRWELVHLRQWFLKHIFIEPVAYLIEYFPARNTMGLPGHPSGLLR